jgi:hypothetical protein
MDPTGNADILDFALQLFVPPPIVPRFSWCSVQGQVNNQAVTQNLPYCPLPPKLQPPHRHPPCGQPFFVEAFASTLDMNATFDNYSAGISRCARYVTEALIEGGANVQRLGNAYQYGPQILQAGFVNVQEVAAGQSEPPSSYTRQAGDVAVFDRTDTHRSGHIAGFDGNKWVSDHFQLHYNPYRDPSSSGHSIIYRSKCPEFK